MMPKDEPRSFTISCVPLEYSDKLKYGIDVEGIFPKGVAQDIVASYEELRKKKVVNIKNYIINENATIIFWDDGTKTVVKKSKEDKFDKRLGLLIGYFQKNCGMSKTKANKFLDNLVVENKKEK